MATLNEHRARLRSLRRALRETELAAGGRDFDGPSFGRIRREILDELEAMARAVDPRDAVETLSANQPVLLQPVRIETIFSAGDAGPELRVRIVPDPVSIDSHEPALTAEERERAEAVWRSAWPNPPELSDAMALAGAELTKQHDVPRVAWLLRSTRPSNLGEPEPAPHFPDPPSRPGSWTRPALSRTLPDRFVVLGYRGGDLICEHAGRVVPDPLPLGLNPLTTDVNSALPRWMTDFEEAERLGLALRISLDSDSAREGFDRLVVLGVKASVDPEEGAALVRELFDAHRFTEGFGFLAQGTPTNNTQDGRAGRAATEAQAEEEIRAALGELPAGVEGTDHDGARLARAFGLEESAFDAVPNAARHENVSAGAMVAALWPATWGYFLRQMFAGSVRPSIVEDARQHCITHVRGRGPLPAIRVGDLPYGILVAGSLERWRPGRSSTFHRELLELLRGLRRKWMDAVAQVPRAGVGDDAEATLIGILGMESSSRHFGARYGLGEDFLWNLLSFEEDPLLAMVWRGSRVLGRVLLDELGYTDLDPPIARMLFGSEASNWSAPLVQAGPLSEERPLEPNYITWLLRQHSSAGLRTQDFGEQPVPDALLYVVLRHSMLLWMLEAAESVGRRRGLGGGAHLPEPELVGFAGRESSDPWALLSPRLAGGGNVEGLIFRPTEPDLEDVREWLEFRRSLHVLEDLPTAELERLLTETLDTASHRLDAWIVSLFAERLWDRRGVDHGARGMHLGAYGWVEDLRPPEPLETEPADGDARTDPANLGFVHAPSVDQARAATLMLNAWAAHGGATGESTFAIDLSSSQVRDAHWITEGVREGQLLEALLGYRFERRLREESQEDEAVELDEVIHVLRARYPIRDEAVAAVRRPLADVVDGRRLAAAWTPERTLEEVLGDEGATVDLNETERSVLETALSSLVSALDAVGDLALAESSYQAVRGNMHRSAAALDVLAGRRPPEPEVSTTPRSTGTHTWRIQLLLPARRHTQTGWTVTARAVAEPALEAWAGRLLGDPRRICYRTETRPVDGERRLQSSNLAALGRSALDFVYASGSAEPTGATEIETMLLWLALRDAPDDAEVEIDIDSVLPDDAGGSDMRPLAEVMELARRMREVVTRGRAMVPEQLGLLDDRDEPGARVDVAELTARLNAVVERATRAAEALRVAVDVATPERATVWAAVRDGLQFSPAGRLPFPASGLSATEALTAYARRLRVDLLGRVDATRVVGASGRSDDPELVRFGAAAPVVAAFHALLGSDFRVLPRVNPTTDALVAWSSEDTTSDELLEWFQQAARVRPALEAYELMSMQAEAHTGRAPRLRQIELDEGDPEAWRLTLLADLPFDDNLADGLSGLVVDEFVERLPRSDQLTGIGLHWDQPGARAPQALLLAVPSEHVAAWRFDDLVAIVNESLDLAKIRAVDRDMLQGVGHFLPAIALAVNNDDATVSSDLTPCLSGSPSPEPPSD